jgi:hypothetical protein
LNGGMKRFVCRYGPFVTAVCGGVTVCAMYLVMSITKEPVLLLIEYFLVSLGSGTAFLAALSSSIELGRPIGVGIVSLTMSLSIR